MPFMTIDMLGGVFNDLSLAFKEKFIVLASITYTLVVVSAKVVFRASATNLTKLYAR